MKRHSNGFYRNWDNCQAAIDDLVSTLGTFPTHTQMNASKKYPHLANRIIGHHGMDCIVQYKNKKRPLQELLKEASPRYPQGHWNLKNSLAEYARVAKEIGHAPSYTELNKMDLCGLANAIAKKYGGCVKMQERLGLQKRKAAAGSWPLERVEDVCRQIIADRGSLPTFSAIEQEHPGLEHAIKEYGGIVKFRRQFNVLTRDKKPKGYWTKSTIVNEAKLIVKEYGHLPTQQQLYAMGKSDLSHQITTQYGFAQLRKRLKLEVKREAPRYWTQERVLRECKNILRKHGHLPPQEKLAELGYAGLGAAIGKQGGFTKYRTELGLEQQQKRATGFWEDEQNAIREATTIMAQHRWETLPGPTILRKEGHAALVAAANRHYGGLNAFREKVEQHVNGVSETQQLERLLEQYAAGKKENLEKFLTQYMRREVGK